MRPPTFADVVAAAERIAGHVERTAVLRVPAVDALVGAAVHLKAEHHQIGGAFKLRGATNAVQSLPDEVAARGVAAHSSGNHAAALARAAAARSIPCHVVMPTTAPRTKLAATRAQGAMVTFCEPTMAAREAALREVLERTGATEVHPSADPAVIAGQGTAALELLDEVPGLDTIVAPVGGGGLLSGTALAAHGVSPAIQVRGAEPATLADAHRSLEARQLRIEGNTTSVADGLVAVLGPVTLGILLEHEVQVVTVTDSQILDAMELLHRLAGELVEPSAATALAGLRALVDAGVEVGEVGLILSGGNLDHDAVPFLSR